MTPARTEILPLILAPVYRSLPTIALLNVVVAALLASVLYAGIAPLPLGLWLGGICLVSAARLLLWQHNRRHPMTAANAWRRANLFVLGAGAAGVLWGTAGALFFIPDNPLLLFFLIMVLGGMTGGALVTSSQHPPAYYAFAATCLAPLALRVVTIGDSFFVTLGILIGLYLTIMVGLSHRIGKSFADAILFAQERDTIAAKFQDFAAVSSDWFWETDDKLRFSYVSHHMKKTGKLDPVYLLGKTLGEVWQSRSDPKDWQKLRDDLARHRPFRNFVCQYPSEKGEPHFFQMSGKPLFDKDERFLGYRGVATDITLERRTENALREEQERLQDTIDNVFDGIVTIDETGRIQSVNPAVATMFGYTAEECIGMPFFETFVPISYGTNRAPGGGLTASLQSLNAASSIRENVALRKDGSIFYVDLVMSRMMYRGEEVRIAVVRDITQQKELHTQLLQASKLGILGEMAAGVTYELSQPLNIIRMAAENALLSAATEMVDPKSAQEKFKTIAEQSKKMGETINHLRVFSRNDNDQTEPFYVSWIVEQAVQLVESAFAIENIRIVTEMPNEPISVKGSVSRIEQILLSLLHNAKNSITRRWQEEGKAEKGEITVRVRISNDGQMVRIVVLDDGLGIPAEHLDRVFDPAFATREGEKVAGLGLFIVHGIVTAMGGDIVATNGPIGTRFEVTLPRAMEENVQSVTARFAGQ
ncbi:MAG: PAS domain S-box protein [Alphaproteobacteria bacterium]